MAEITPLFGGPKPGEVNEQIVEELELLLADAKAGELIAIGYCTVRGPDVPNPIMGTGWVGNAGTRYSLAGGIMMLHHRYADALLHKKDED